MMEDQMQPLLMLTCLDWAPIVLSLVAILVAIFVPWQIAKRQNRIAIFEKLYVAYSQMLLVKSFSSAIKSYLYTGDLVDTNRNRQLFCVHFETGFGYRPDLSSFDACNISIGSATAALRKNETQVYMVPMLISKNEKEKEKCSKMISSVFEPLFLLLTDIILFDPEKAVQTETYQKNFVTAVEILFDEYATIIENALLLGGKRRKKHAKKPNNKRYC